jgi:hypothetical protein
MIIFACLLASFGTTGCISSQPPEPGDVVTCSEYSQVTDSWSTPSGDYVYFDNGRTYDTRILLNNGYSRVPLKGEYVSCTEFSFGCNIIRLKPLFENESGLRDACMVMP